MQLLRIIRVEKDQRVEVSVAGVKNIHTAQCIFFLHGLDRAQHFSQPLARYRGVHAHVIRADPASRGKGVFAPAPEFQSLSLVPADRDARGAAALQDLAHATDFFLYFIDSAVTFAKQDRRGVEVIASMDKVFNRCGHPLVHQLQARRNDAGCDHCGDRIASGFKVWETRHDAPRQLRFRDQLDCDFKGHGQHAFTADQQRQQIQPGRVQRAGAESYRLTAGVEAAYSEHIVQGQAVLQAMHTA